MMVEKLLGMLGIDADTFKRQAEAFRAEAMQIIQHFNAKLTGVQDKLDTLDAKLTLIDARLAALDPRGTVIVDDANPSLPLLLNGTKHNEH